MVDKVTLGIGGKDELRDGLESQCRGCRLKNQAPNWGTCHSAAKAQTELRSARGSPPCYVGLRNSDGFLAN